MLSQLTHLIFQAIRAQLSVNVSEGFLVWWNTSLRGLSYSSHYVSLRETRNSVQSWKCSASPRNHLETNSPQISEHLTRQDGQQTTHKEHHFQETSKSQKIVVGLKVYFKEPVNLIEIRSCQNMFSKRFLSPFHHCSSKTHDATQQGASTWIKWFLQLPEEILPQKKFYTVHHHSIPDKTSINCSIVS